MARVSLAFFVFETESQYVALAGPQLAFFCLPCAGSKCVHHHAKLALASFKNSHSGQSGPRKLISASADASEL